MSYKIIPDTALNKELNQSDFESKDIAQKEKNRVDQGQYKKKLEDSKDEITLFLDWLYKYGIGFLFLLACVLILFTLGCFAYLVFNYIRYLVEDICKLEIFLHDAWKVLSGASVILFVQFLGWTVKNKHNELKDRNK